MKTTIILVGLVVLLTTTGFECVNEGALISVNLQGLTGTFAVNQGQNVSGCTGQINPSSYLDSGFGTISGVRIYDIRVSTIGSYAGSINNGEVTVNGTPILRYSGTWSAFNTPQSIINSPLVSRLPGGVQVLVNAVLARRAIDICGTGALTQAVTQTGLSVRIEVLGQVDGEL